CRTRPERSVRKYLLEELDEFEAGSPRFARIAKAEHHLHRSFECHLVGLGQFETVQDHPVRPPGSQRATAPNLAYVYGDQFAADCRREPLARVRQVPAVLSSPKTPCPYPRYCFLVAAPLSQFLRMPEARGGAAFNPHEHRSNVSPLEAVVNLLL